jgi:hypothetical protein
MPTAAPPGRRNRRFERATERLPFQLTQRDEDIIRAVARHRFLRSRHIQALLPGSSKHLLHRLTGLYHAGYLDRPRAQLDYYSTAGSAPMVYALADRGAKHLNTHDGLNLAEVEWSRKNRSAGRPFIEHALAIADLHVALIVACRARPGIQLIDTNELIANFPQPPVSHERAFAWPTQVQRNGVIHKVTVKPDYAFGVRSPTISRRCYLAECDRGTMPLVRADYDQTSIERKLAAYIRGYDDKLHEHLFGWKALRILFVTNAEERAHNMRSVLANLTKATNIRRLFYFTDTRTLAAGNVLSQSWVDGNGELVTLI